MYRWWQYSFFGCGKQIVKIIIELNVVKKELKNMFK